MSVYFKNIFYYIFFFWLIGLEQFVITPLYLLVNYIYDKKLTIESFMAPFIVIIFFMFFSVFNLNEPIKFLQLFRNIYSFIGAILILNFYYRHSQSLYVSTNSFFKTIYFGTFIISFSGFLPLIGINFSIETIFYSLSSNEFLKKIFYKTLADPDSGLFFIEGFIRPKGLMLFPNELSQINVLNIVIGLYLFTIRKIPLFIFSIFTFISSLVLISTLSRASWIALLISILIAQIIKSLLRKKISINLFITLFFVIFIGYFLNIFDLILSRFDNAHSNSGRLTNYIISSQMTFSSFWSMLFGHGSQVNFITKENILELGSHSTYIGIMFKYGILALISYIYFQLNFLRNIILSFKKNIINEHKFILFIQIIIISIVHSLFYDIDVDINIILFYFACLGAIASEILVKPQEIK